jgi:hypothetical protein
VSDSELRQALLGTWRLISFQSDVDGPVAKPFSDNPQGYLVYTTDDHVFVQIATRADRVWPGPEVLEQPVAQRMAALGYFAYCGSFEVRDGAVFHNMEFGVWQRLSGRVETRSIVVPRQ